LVQIKKVKSLHGTMYAVVESFTSQTVDTNKKPVITTKDYPVEYNNGSRVEVAMFPVTNEGLAKAKEVQKTFNRK
jgi:hypothetical protein